MKNIIFCCILLCTFSSIVNCQVVDTNLDGKSLESKKTVCKNNSDNLYNRQQIFNQLADILNTSIPEYRAKLGFGFKVENEEPVGFGIYDLTDTSNKYLDENDCINFIDGHVYNVFPFSHRYSLNHIIILESKVLTNFNSVNCVDRGNTIEDVSEYLDRKISDNDPAKEVLLNQVKNYRKFGRYVRVGPLSKILCEVNN